MAVELWACMMMNSVKTIHERKVWCVSLCVYVCVVWAMYIATVTCECLQMLLTCCI